VSAADKGCRVYSLDPRPDSVALYSGCTPGKRRAWFLPDDRHPASLVGFRGGWRHARTKVFTRTYGSNAAVPGNISYFEARKLIAPQLSQTYAQVTKPSIATSTTQADENITKIKCPPLQLLRPLSSVPQPNAISFSFHIIYHSGKPLAFRIFNKPTTQIESRLPEPISASAAAPDNSLNTSTSSLSTETCPAPTTSNKFAALQPSVPLSEFATTTPNSELSNTSKVPQNVKQNSKNRRKRTKHKNQK
ncbi:uncharacterized protein TNCV_1846411, partial [Trichonephila clavipes]